MYNIAKVNADGKGAGKGASEQRKARLAFCLTCQPRDAFTAYFGELADKEAVCRSVRCLVVVLSFVCYISSRGENGSSFLQLSVWLPTPSYFACLSLT